MKRYYDQSQVAWIMVITILALIVWMIVKTWETSDAGGVYLPLGMVTFILLLLGRMRVTVDKANLCIRFLLGFPRATVPVTNIKNVETYQSKRQSGFGLKVQPSQGQYHVFGSGGVIVMRHEGAPLMISSPDPRQLKSALDKACARNKE